MLSYSLVYMLRKPYTAAAFEDLEVFNMDYKVAVTIVQILGYVVSKFMGIKLISELRREERLRFILMSVVMAELSLVFFGLLSAPYNIAAMFLNGLSLGCMWGIIFSFIEGRRMTDVLASLLGVSMVISSGTAKSVGLYVMDTWQVSEFWMPALIGAVALPLLALLGYALNRLPQPTEEDIALKSERETLNGRQRWELFKHFMPFLTMLFVANIAIVVLRDIKEDFLVNIIDMSGYSPWLFTQIDCVVTLTILAIFGLMVLVKEIADWIDMAPSILSSLYTTVLPNYFEGIKSYPPEEALDSALALVNNVSKKRLLSHIEEMILRLDQMELAEPDSLKDNPFAKQLMEETRLSASKIEAFKGIYTSYSLSSSSDCLKMEPFLLSPSDNQVRVGRISAYGEAQWGFGIMPDPQNFHCMLNENQAPQFTMVTIYLQIPFFKNPRQLRGLYIGQDYNRNPIARRILLIKESESTEIDEFMSRKSGLIDKEGIISLYSIGMVGDGACPVSTGL